MHLNTEPHRELGCPSTLHKIEFDPVATTAETCDFWYRSLRNHHTSLFTLNLTRPLF
jgi:hypothetical protein